MQEVFILSAARTPLGGFGGNLSSLSATALGSLALKGAINKLGLSNNIPFDEVLMGNVLSANLGQAPARQAAIHAGLNVSTPCTTINKVCASGMKAVMLGAQAIMCGQADLLVAGGMESMSNAPYYLPKARFGYKYGHGSLVDGLSRDGLEEAYHDFPMGNCAENTAREMKISREAQDDYAINSYKRAAEAWKKGSFSAEVVPVNVKDHKGNEQLIKEDEDFRKVLLDKIPKLKPAFEADGTVTAANSSTISDGAAALVIGTREMAKKLDLKPIAKIRGFADAARNPMWFTTAPALAIPKALKQAGLALTDMDYFEINEAFAAVAIANQQLLKIPEEKLNVYGGAIALGHPLGCSGARILTTLLSVLHQEKGRLGVAGICNGGGGASAIVIEMI
ncbi:acetyl-CoA C-acyltransferase [Cyclobacterium plantarum]|uniref:acetyl-CoA C-acetyltransferase n=1 Tax=Cyclobacterium plantarum TaxID=2716263 RepID=A0ABX0HCV1_9BACT|nr:acetyl-CoA C-acyltransferase [Cyclobacterium plantarum]NHE57982.1 acetyl-CoA C-acyltransferase [Cyclobacterium plantarum]